MNRVTAGVLIITLLAGAAACSDRGPSEPGSESLSSPSGMVVSNAQPTLRSPSAGAAGRATAGAIVSVAYLSAAPGTFARARSLTIRNISKGGLSIDVAIINDGFDPLGVDAVAGDTLSLSVAQPAGLTSYMVIVPRRRPPVVIRTIPPKGRTDVALNIRPVWVFSEPVNGGSVTGASASLIEGENRVIDGTLQVASDGLSAEFIPDAPLQPGTTYTLVASAGIQDQDGDALSEASTTSFATEWAEYLSTFDIAFVQWSDKQIYRIRNSGAPFRLTATGNNGRPAWSPDGKRIAYGSYPTTGNSNADIYMMNADGSGVVRRTVGANFWAAEWSPDGTKLAVSNEGIYYSDISVISADDDGAAPVHLATDARSPSWSPNGTKIAFVRTSGDDGYDSIWLMNTDGSEQVALTPMGGGINVRPTWSPDGNHLAFSKCLGAEGCDAYTMNADGSDLRRITSAGTIQEAIWSPDGKWIAVSLWVYGSGQTTTVTLAYVPASGGAPRTLAYGYHPSWRP